MARRVTRVCAGVVAAAVAAAGGAWWSPLGPATAPARPPATWATVQTAAARGDWREAERRLTAWLGENPGDGKAWAVLGGVYVNLGRPDAARAALARVGSDDDAWPSAHALLADVAMKSHDAPAAERAFAALAARDPAAAAPRKGLIYLLSLQLRTAEARARLWELYRNDPKPETLADLVQALFQVENDVRGLGPDLEAFLRVTPNDPFLRRARGLALHWRGRHSEASPHLEAAAATLENDLTGRFALAECRRAAGDDGSTFDAVRLLGPRPPRAADASLWSVDAARLAEAAGRGDDALRFLRDAVDLNPEDREAQFRLGQALARRGDAPAAKARLDRAAAIQDRSRGIQKALADARRDGFTPESLERLGRLCRDAGLTAEARACWELALRAEPGRSSTRAALNDLPTADSLPIAMAAPTRRASADPEFAVRARPLAAPSPVRFEDVAAQSGLVFSYDSGAQGDLFIVDTMGGGVGLIDYDGDGRLDVYFVNGCALAAGPTSRPNKLFRNLGNLEFEDVTDRAGVGGCGYGMGCATGDYDGDGLVDLFVTGFGRTVLYRNRGDGTFEDVTIKARVSSNRWTTAAGFGDLDGDGDLDLVVVTYVDADPKTAPACRDNAGGAIHCSPGYFPAQTDLLFRNDGDGTFTEVGLGSGFDLPNGRGLGLAVADLDSDGKLDLFVANDASPNYFLRNLGGLKFEDAGLLSGLACDGSGRATASMGVAAADLDGDGKIDLFHTNFLNEPNSLKLGDGEGRFIDATLAAGLDAPSRAVTGFGTVAIDADNDGKLDLFVANGHVDDQPWVNSPMAQPPQFYRNLGKGRFALAGPEVSAYLAKPAVGRGVAAGDLDDDGRVDLVVVHRDAPAALLRNVSETPGHWLTLALVGKKPGRTPVGARVACRTKGGTSVQWVTSGTGYLSANDPRVHFGLGPDATVETLEVRWPSGLTQTWVGLAADRVITIEEGGDPVARVRGR